MQEKNALCAQFAVRLSEAIAQSGLTQKSLAESVSITPQTLSKYKKGDRIPDTEELYRLAKFFGVSIDWLLGGDESSGESTWKQRAIAAEKRLAKIADVLVLLGKANATLTEIASGKE